MEADKLIILRLVVIRRCLWIPAAQKVLFERLSDDAT